MKRLERAYAPTVYAAACRLGYCYLGWRSARALGDGESVLTHHTRRPVGFGEEEPGIWVGWSYAERCFVVAEEELGPPS